MALKHAIYSAFDILCVGVFLYLTTGLPTSVLNINTMGEAASAVGALFAILYGSNRVFMMVEIKKVASCLLTEQKKINSNAYEKMDVSHSIIKSNLARIETKICLASLDRLYSGIPIEFSRDKDDIIEKAKTGLTSLSTNLETAPMEKGKYYNWINDAFSRTKSGDQILAISRMKTSEWVGSPEENKFMENNVAAGKNGANIERIFVTSIETIKLITSTANDLNKFNPKNVLSLHSKKAKNGMSGMFADEKRIEHENPKLLADIGDGFLIFIDGKTQEAVVLLDNFTHDEEARGTACKRDEIVSQYQSLFQQLKALSEMIDEIPSKSFSADTLENIS